MRGPGGQRGGTLDLRAGIDVRGGDASLGRDRIALPEVISSGVGPVPPANEGAGKAITGERMAAIFNHHNPFTRNRNLSCRFRLKF